MLLLIRRMGITVRKFYMPISRVNEQRLGNYDNALQADSVSISIKPDYSRAYVIRGEIYASQKNFRLADSSYSAAIVNYNNDNKTQVSYIYSERGDARLNRRLYKDAINDYFLFYFTRSR